MIKKTVLSLFIFAFAVNGWGQQKSSALDGVVQAENSFADTAAEKGTRAAFLAFAAPTAVVFTTKPENAQENWQKRQANSSLLSWRPAWADVSASGDLGYTTGPWAFSRTKTDAPVGWGEYFTIWKKQPDGSWKFLLDLGIQHEKAEVVVNQWKSPAAAGKNKPGKDSADVWNKLENSFAGLLIKNGAKKTYEKLASDQIRLLRDDNMPFQGKAGAISQITDSQLSIKVLGGEASSDLAYAYGEYEVKTPDGKVGKGFYARIWKLESKGWRITAEVAHLLPPQKS